MTFTSGASALSGIVLCGLLLSCSGSSSETPWPAEPLDLEAGPAGEGRTRGNVIDTKKLPDNYTKQQEEKAKQKAVEANSADPAIVEAPEPPAAEPTTSATATPAEPTEEPAAPPAEK